ncbi:MAG: proteasome accessory factor PafA2 family protein [Planctomycetaceae bacterium]|nr:proteasome accessory factor PafA2 family protein [Planctomycetaceae bacterium]
MPRNRLFGLETEYAFSALGRNGQRLDRAEWATRFMEHATSRLPNLPDRAAGGMFLETGGRFYRDSGYHPELTTPEVTNPWDVCRYVVAGDRLLQEVAHHLATQYTDLGQIILSRSNVSYGPHPTTWACHESYGHQSTLDVLPSNLIPHLVSRIIYTGSGGFNNRSPGIEFLISPRVAHIHNVSSDRSQDDRGIYHTKDESLSSPGTHRLHVLCGESVCSHRSNWLRVATTALVVAMIEGGVAPGVRVTMRDPVQAFGAFSRDVELRHAAVGSDGALRTAVAIQRHYLEQAEHHAGASFMPPWTETALREWRKVLDDLEGGPGAVARSLDWAIKLALYRQAADRLGLAWESVPTWSLVLTRLVDGMISAQKLPAEQRLSHRSLTPDVVAPNGPIPQVVDALSPVLRDKGLSWSQFPAVLKLRQQLLELDTRFTEVGPQGIFAGLEAAGVLEHAVPGVDNIDFAMRNPPSEGRGRLRGECVKRFAPRRTEFSATWTGVTDLTGRRHLNLNEPFCSEEQWRDVPAPPIPPPPTTPQSPPRTVNTSEDLMLARGIELYATGQYPLARDLFTSVPLVPITQNTSPKLRAIRRLHALTMARLGDSRMAEALMLTVSGAQPTDLPQLVDRVCINRFFGLAPGAATTTWIERALRCMAQSNGTHPRAAVAFRDHYTAWLVSQDRLGEAREQLECYRRGSPSSGTCPRLFARMQLTLAEIDRRQHRYDEAHRLTHSAHTLQLDKGYRGDVAEFAIPMQVRLELDLGVRLNHLESAKAIQTELGHVPGLVRTLVLEARVRGEGERSNGLRHRIAELQGRTPGLVECGILKRILANWPAWTTHQILPGATDYFAGV